MTKKAKKFAQENNIRLMDEDEIMELILNHYDKLPDTIKDWIPIKKVWIPFFRLIKNLIRKFLQI